MRRGAGKDLESQSAFGRKPEVRLVPATPYSFELVSAFDLQLSWRILAINQQTLFANPFFPPTEPLSAVQEAVRATVKLVAVSP